MPAPPASPGHGARSASGAVPRRSLLYKLSGFLTATFWLSYVVLAACVGACALPYSLTSKHSTLRHT